METPKEKDVWRSKSATCVRAVDWLLSLPRQITPYGPVRWMLTRRNTMMNKKNTLVGKKFG